MTAARAVCQARFEAFGSAGRAAAIKPVPLEQMTAKYRRRAAARH